MIMVNVDFGPVSFDPRAGHFKIWHNTIIKKKERKKKQLLLDPFQ